MTIMEMVQAFVDGYGLWISKEKLVDKVYRFMESKGHSCYEINGKYIGIDNQEFQFIKSRKEDRWIVKAF